MIRLIASDLDGTLRNENHCLDEKTVNYLKKLAGRRIEFILASGRAMELIEPLFAKYDFRCGVIALNGALVYDAEGKTLWRKAMDRTQAKALTDWIRRQGLLGIAVMEKGNWCSDPKAYQKRMEAIVKGMTDPVLFAEEHGFLTLTKTPFEELGDCYKIEIYSPLRSLMDTLQRTTEFKVSMTGKDVIEITDGAASKGAALKQICDQRRLKNQEVLCFGDSENDLEMLEAFRYGHIMRNAEERLQAQINHIAPANTAYGVLRVIENYTGIALQEEEE